MGLREIKMERTRQLIADTAIALFSEQGFDATTIEQIAAAAEVGPRTVYRYYPTKEALVVRFTEDTLHTALDELRGLPEELPLPQALFQVVDSVRRTIEGDSERRKAVYRIIVRTRSLHAELRAVNWTWRENLAAEIRRRTGGRTTEVVAALAAANVAAVVEISIAEWARSEEPAALGLAIEQALELLRTGDVPTPTPV
ncbi:TetR/AcrR family transcriptional regulator [Streptomyces pseudovenezuelae]|uniref:AcrR family transcriptional regulator n=1 Tax=Streptomyces pseudovenezuelae TaxID=67350 RepID=A0ABT6LPT1_9ACTN|nr:TetR family transcriptional regulator [Streptomyces pseudovenezuelae]MDH6218248.1 AcrR family transcriptional regulator [Streptomyces pseudovenezuelae]